jgi:hypothetical protein
MFKVLLVESSAVENFLLFLSMGFEVSDILLDVYPLPTANPEATRAYTSSRISETSNPIDKNRRKFSTADDSTNNTLNMSNSQPRKFNEDEEDEDRDGSSAT